ncbi:MAG: CHAP domain-containing protein [Patescibacteria group bacterium]|nr:CHAP domain-containing protein [Patescibacteria group bacterium]
MAGLSSGLALDIPKAQAATITQANLDLARDIVNNISPDILQNQTQNSDPVSFTPDGYLTKPLVTETVVTPEVPKPRTVQKNPISVASKVTKISAAEAGAHYFPYGYCTYYVSQRRMIPWSGNAIAWLSGARSFGYATGNTPQVGAIVVTSEGGKTGHVAMVDGVSGDQITLTEMNYRGFGVISSRTISASYGAILGYIY